MKIIADIERGLGKCRLPLKTLIFVLYFVPSVFTTSGQQRQVIAESISEQSILHNLRTPRVVLKPDVVGLFVGISNYGERAKVQSNPAHTLSAAIVYDLFYRSSLSRDEKNLRKFIKRWRFPGLSFEDPISSNLTLLADLRLSPTKDRPFAEQLYSNLGYLCGTAKLLHRPSDSERIEVDATYPYFGDGRPMSKARLRAAISEVSGRFSQSISEGRQHLLVFYIAAHGALTSEGRPYVLTADSDAGDPHTWYFYDDLLSPFYKVSSEHESTAHRVLVVIDACQQYNHASLAMTRALANRRINVPPQFVTVILSSSPGQFAWQYDSTNKTSVTRSVGRSGSGFDTPKPSSGKFEEERPLTIGLLPLATQSALTQLVGYSDTHPTSSKDITLSEWCEGITNVTRLLAAELDKPDKLPTYSRDQDVQVIERIGIGNDNSPVLFTIVEPSPKNERK